jgi:hypothetical protein
MDMRTGDLYVTKEKARAAGVSEEYLAEVEPEIVRIINGPFKGRVYQRHPRTRQLERRIDLESNSQEA